MRTTPKTGWALRWAKLVCRIRGHNEGVIVKYSKRWVTIARGCARCEVGTVERYPTRGPLPAAVKAAAATSKASGGAPVST